MAQLLQQLPRFHMCWHTVTEKAFRNCPVLASGGPFEKTRRRCWSEVACWFRSLGRRHPQAQAVTSTAWGQFHSEASHAPWCSRQVLRAVLEPLSTEADLHRFAEALGLPPAQSPLLCPFCPAAGRAALGRQGGASWCREGIRGRRVRVLLTSLRREAPSLLRRAAERLTTATRTAREAVVLLPGRRVRLDLARLRRHGTAVLPPPHARSLLLQGVTG